MSEMPSEDGVFNLILQAEKEMQESGRQLSPENLQELSPEDARMFLENEFNLGFATVTDGLNGEIYFQEVCEDLKSYFARYNKVKMPDTILEEFVETRTTVKRQSDTILEEFVETRTTVKRQEVKQEKKHRASKTRNKQKVPENVNDTLHKERVLAGSPVDNPSPADLQELSPEAARKLLVVEGVPAFVNIMGELGDDISKAAFEELVDALESHFAKKNVKISNSIVQDFVKEQTQERHLASKTTEKQKGKQQISAFDDNYDYDSRDYCEDYYESPEDLADLQELSPEAARNLLGEEGVRAFVNIMAEVGDDISKGAFEELVDAVKSYFAKRNIKLSDSIVHDFVKEQTQEKKKQQTTVEKVPENELKNVNDTFNTETVPVTSSAARTLNQNSPPEERNPVDSMSETQNAEPVVNRRVRRFASGVVIQRKSLRIANMLTAQNAAQAGSGPMGRLGSLKSARIQAARDAVQAERSPVVNSPVGRRLVRHMKCGCYCSSCTSCQGRKRR